MKCNIPDWAAMLFLMRDPAVVRKRSSAAMLASSRERAGCGQRREKRKGGPQGPSLHHSSQPGRHDS